MITVKQMAAYAQHLGASITCHTYKEFVKCRTWEEVINSDQARDFLLYFKGRSERNANALGVNWEPIFSLNIVANRNHPSLTLEEVFAKDAEITTAQRQKDDTIKSANLEFEIFLRDRNTSDNILYRKMSRKVFDVKLAAERAFEDTETEIEERYNRLAKDKIITALAFIPEFMKKNTITHDYQGDEIDEPEDCNPLDVYCYAEGLDEE